METCARLSVSIFIITSRTSKNDVYDLFQMNGVDRITLDRLVKVIYVRPSEDTDIGEAKKMQREVVKAMGYDILMYLGDNYADLDICNPNGDSSVNVLFDNPFR